MDFLFEQGESEGKKFLLLHGTGGDEHSLVDVARFMDEQSTILSFRGEIKEDGMNRFFKRSGVNQFDLPNLEKETDRLLDEIEKHSQQANIPMEDWTIIGYSNGANIAAHLLLERETPVRRAILLHPMFLGVDQAKFSLAGKSVWLSYGLGDSIVTRTAFEKLTDAFNERQADVTAEIFDDGHAVLMEELEKARDWLERQE